MRRITAILAVMCGCIFFFPWPVPAADELAEADRLFALGGLENFQKSIPIYAKAAAQDPGSFEANWKSARAHREYANQAKRQEIADWKNICAEHGKAGMQMAQKAIDLQPDKPDGYYYYGVNVGIYSDGVSIVTALAEGLKDQTQSSFEKAYAIDKNYRQGGPMLSLGRFWTVLPWPLHDRPKALTYFREYQKAGFFDANLEAHLFLSELLIKLGGEANQAEAKKYLEKASQSPDSYFKNWATRLLADIGK
jgi:tetratricopeptide (TPR) repeat protein